MSNDGHPATDAGHDKALQSGSRGAGESGGGPYPNPHTGKSPAGGFTGHGGQTEIDQKLTPGEPKER